MFLRVNSDCAVVAPHLDGIAGNVGLLPEIVYHNQKALLRKFNDKLDHVFLDGCPGYTVRLEQKEILLKALTEVMLENLVNVI